MYLIERKNKEEGLTIINYFGPFPTERRAKEYAGSFDANCTYKIMPMIVPNCVTVKHNY